MPTGRRRKVAESSSGEASGKNTKRKREECANARTEVNHEEDKNLLLSVYGLSFPKDFYDLWDFCREINPAKPREALIPTLKFELVGPYEVLSKQLEVNDDENRIKIHLHWRFYYDPPEFMTVIISKHKQEPTYHVGYWRDDPKDTDCFIARTGGDNWSVALLGDNIFYEIHHRLNCRLATARGKEALVKLQQLKESLYKFVEERGINMDSEHRLKLRQKKIVTPGLHGAGLVVPLDENEVGYRPVGETRAKLLKLFKNIDEAPNDDIRMGAFDPLQELITFVQLANDECDFGMGLELGTAMFCYGSKWVCSHGISKTRIIIHTIYFRYLNKAASRMLSMAYSLLERGLYKKIIECHLVDRRRKDYRRFSLN